MKAGFVKSSPHFFSLINRSMLILVGLLLIGAALIPAPLQEAADPALTPNPAKSAWFLLWTQELVSWSRLMIYPIIALAGLFFLLPWLPGAVHLHRARWFPKEQLAVTILTTLVFVIILVLTIVALFFRGANWSLTFSP